MQQQVRKSPSGLFFKALALAGLVACTTLGAGSAMAQAKPKIKLAEGLAKFVAWRRAFGPSGA